MITVFRQENALMNRRKSRMRRLVATIGACIALFGMLLVPLDTAAAESAAQDPPPGSPRVYMPLVLKDYAPVATRIGFDALDENLSRYPNIGRLSAGWYTNWTTALNPLRPNSMEFVQMIRLHEVLTCPLNDPNAWNRSVCPYAEPPAYAAWPGENTIEQTAIAHPGSLWLIGNEMDRRDWPTGRQDETRPETYARAYHDLYTQIKGVDPTARVAIGGVIQATPLRLEYLTKTWDFYLAEYGTPMPVDVWNVHSFILRERQLYPGCGDCYGADIPPGSNARTGMLYSDEQHVSMSIFNAQIRAFRQWMKDRGQQDKPLIVSEYGVLYGHIANADEAGEVENFMTATFDYFLNTKDCSLGLPADQCRLVQRWAWYSLDDDGDWTGSDFNQYGALFNRATGQMTSTGARFRDWVAAHWSELSWP